MRDLRNKFRLGETLRLGFWVWVKNLIPFTGLSLLLHLPLLAWTARMLATDDPIEAYRGNEWFLPLGEHLTTTLLAAAVTYGVVMELERREVSMRAVVGQGLRRFLPALAVGLVTGIAVFLSTLLLIIPGLIVSCMLFVAVPASVIERPGVLGALGRSRALTAGNRVKMFWLALLTLVIYFVSAILAGVALALIAPNLDSNGPIVATVELVRSVLVAPFTATLAATAYVLLRRQRDGVDTAALASVFA